MEKRWLAHSAEDGREQSIRQHLKGTAEMARRFAESFGAGDEAYAAGIMHDIGKYSDAFQRRLHGGPKVDHATAGAYELLRAQRLAAAFGVAGHHGGLPNCGGNGDTADKATFKGRMKKALLGKVPDYSAWITEAAPLPTAAWQRPHDKLDAAMMIRMLFSCLTDADFLDTEAFMSDGDAERGYVADWEAIAAKLQCKIAPWLAAESTQGNLLNVQRTAILRRCLTQGEQQPQGLFTLTVPTGGGKTIASLAFAIKQAQALGKQRIIYVIPYTSIIEQTAAVFRSFLGDENVLEHHSLVEYENAAEGEATQMSLRLARATENWDMPIVVTTAVQFFESLFAARTSRCRKLHNIANSVVIFDEAQMLPIPYLRPCVWAIASLVRNYGVCAVLCTATQPALDKLFAEFMPQIKLREICSEATYDEKLFRRVRFQQEGDTSVKCIADALAAQSAGLCIVNTRANAKAVYDQLPPEGRFHLSTLMVPKHRKAQLDEIRAILAHNQMYPEKQYPCRVVSTSLIEAGVDVDFPVVWREEAGLDSVLQAAGRCNREGQRSAEDSIVHVFRLDETPAPLFRQPTDCYRFVTRRFADIAQPQAIHAYFQQLLMFKGREALDQKHILDTLSQFQFADVAENFHLIENNTHTVYIPLDEESREAIVVLKNGNRNRALMRLLARYSVSIYDAHFRALLESGDVELLCENGDAILVNEQLYNKHTGLSLQADVGKALFG